jgi:hypothetical protein
MRLDQSGRFVAEYEDYDHNFDPPYPHPVAQFVQLATSEQVTDRLYVAREEVLAENVIDAGHGWVVEEVLRRLAADEDEEVRVAVAYNCHTPEYVRMLLAEAGARALKGGWLEPRGGSGAKGLLGADITEGSPDNQEETP